MTCFKFEQITATIISTEDVITTVVTGGVITAIVAGGVPPGPIQPGTLPQGVPQPGTCKNSLIMSKSHLINFEIMSAM